MTADPFGFFGTTRAPRVYDDSPFPVALTIAGSDSGGGAGIQADLKTFAACEVFGTSILTLVTAQNTVGVTKVQMLDEEIVRAQFEAVLEDIPPGAAKLGALGSNQMIGLIAELLTEHPIKRLVIDPVMVTKHGEPLMATAAVKVFRGSLLDKALLVTPNRFEAEALTGQKVNGPTSMKDAAQRIFDFGPRNVLIKGGHMEKIVRDIFYDGTGFIEFGADRVDTGRVHGSGCAFSAAITARLALDDELLAAVEFARQFITDAIARAPKIGKGISPVNPMHGHWG